MNQTPRSERVHIGFFGLRNAGKSSLVNAVTDQELAIVSDKKRTTTDPVYKTMELLPLGPVVIIDTAGFDDEGALGIKRIEKTKEVLTRTDIAVLVVDATAGLRSEDHDLIDLFKKSDIPYLTVYNKSDLTASRQKNNFYVSSKTLEGINELKEKLAVIKIETEQKEQPKLVSDLIDPGKPVILVIPIDESAPKGRIILPQQQVIRDILDAGCSAFVCRETELEKTIAQLSTEPALVITDSQVFGLVSDIVKGRYPLTSFSILMARYKGYLDQAVKSVTAIENLKDGDRILIAEGCTHHRQCNDIGTVKIPAWIRNHIGKDITIETSSGMEFPVDLTPYKLVIHCGGCMQTATEMINRRNRANAQSVPIINYGVLIAYMHGILDECLKPIKRYHR